MGLDYIESTDPSIRKTLKVMCMVGSQYGEEGKAAARILKSRLDARGTGMRGIRSFDPFFKDKTGFENLVRRAYTLWTELGYMKQVVPPAAPPVTPVDDKAWRRNPDTNPGDNYCWVRGYSYKRRGKTITVAGYWRLHPGKGWTMTKKAA